MFAVAFVSMLNGPIVIGCFSCEDLIVKANKNISVFLFQQKEL